MTWSAAVQIALTTGHDPERLTQLPDGMLERMILELERRAKKAEADASQRRLEADLARAAR